MSFNILCLCHLEEGLWNSSPYKQSGLLQNDGHQVIKQSFIKHHGNDIQKPKETSFQPSNVNNLEVATGLAGVLLEHAFWTKQQIEWTSLRESPYKNYDIFPIHQYFLDASPRSQATPLLPSCTLAVASPTPLAAFVAFAHWNVAAAVAAPTSPEMKPPASSRWQVTSLMVCRVTEVRIMCQWWFCYFYVKKICEIVKNRWNR